MKRARLSPPSSLILVSDRSGGDVPTSMGPSLVSASRSCVAVGTLSALDGETSVALGPATEHDVAATVVFCGQIELPTGVIAIRTVLGDVVLETFIGAGAAQLIVCANDVHEPDEIVVLVGRAGSGVGPVT